MKARLIRYIVCVCFMLGAQAWAYSGRSVYVLNTLTSIRDVIETFRVENGRLPNPQYWRDEIAPYVPDVAAVEFDLWKHPYVYRVPGTGRDFDLYSTGRNGADERGAGDDISAWSGVNEGFYWKEHWPTGRAFLWAGPLVGLILLAAIRHHPWRVVVPIAVAASCTVMLVGASLLLSGPFVNGESVQLTLNIVMAAYVVLASWFCVAMKRAFYGPWGIQEPELPDGPPASVQPAQRQKPLAYH